MIGNGLAPKLMHWARDAWLGRDALASIVPLVGHAVPENPPAHEASERVSSLARKETWVMGENVAVVAA